MAEALPRRRGVGTVALSWGPWGGFYVHRKFAWRLCLGWVALTYCPVEMDDLMEAYADRDGGDPAHAAVSWTYMPPERHEEALLRIRRLLKENAGWWTRHDDRLEADAFERLGVES